MRAPCPTDYVLHYEPLTFVDAVATCADDNLLPGGRPGSVLHFEALIPTFAHATTALPDIANVGCQDVTLQPKFRMLHMHGARQLLSACGLGLC